MNRLIPLASLLALLLTPPALTAAQDDTGWPVIEHCVGEPTAPPEGWTFEGTIFLEDSESIHAIKSDVKTPYYVALQVGDFALRGAISPNGQWYATPSGYTRPWNTWSEDTFIADKLRIYTTAPSQQFRSFSWSFSNHGSRGIAPYSLPRVLWLDSENIIYPYNMRVPSETDPSVSIIRPVVLVLNIVSGETTKWQWDGEFSPLWEEISPDWTRVILKNGDEGWGLFDTTSGKQLAGLWETQPSAVWQPDSSHFIMNRVAESGTTLTFFNREGGQLEQIFTSVEINLILTNSPVTTAVERMAWSPNQDYFAFIIRESPYHFGVLHILDMRRKTIINTCITRVEGLTWSPDSSMLAFSSYVDQWTRKVNILDIQAEWLYTISQHKGIVMDWTAN